MKRIKHEILMIDEKGDFEYKGSLIPVNQSDMKTFDEDLQKIGGFHVIMNMMISRISDADIHEFFNKGAIEIIRNRINQLEKVIETLEKYDTSDE